MLGAAGDAAGRSPGWPVDGHVHFHDIARVAPTLRAAADNFAGLGKYSQDGRGAILLAQTSREYVFEALHETGAIDGWTLSRCADESETVIACKDRVCIAIVCGCQVRTNDGLEVLALGTCSRIRDGMPLEEAVAAVKATGALPVVPWGFGKWIGRRGRRLRRLLESWGTTDVFLGDNGSRLDLLGRPRLMNESQAAGFRVLPGTDPFPIMTDYRRVGSFGFVSAATWTIGAPWRSLRNWLVGRDESPAPYGNACRPGTFLQIQIGIQARNRMQRPWQV